MHPRRNLDGCGCAVGGHREQGKECPRGEILRHPNRATGGGWAPSTGQSPSDENVVSESVLMVAGERFRASLRSRRGHLYEYDYTWLTGPNDGYGFTVAGPFEQSEAEHKATIAGFLAEIDPATGYLRDD